MDTLEQQILDEQMVMEDSRQKIQELQAQQIEQSIIAYFSKLPPEQMLPAIGKLLVSIPGAKQAVLQYISDNPI